MNQNANTSDEPLTYTITEAAEILKIGRNLIYDEIKSGNLKTYRVGRRRFCSREQLIEYLQSRVNEQISDDGSG